MIEDRDVIGSSVTDKKSVVIFVFAMNKDSVTYPIISWGHIILEMLSEYI